MSNKRSKRRFILYVAAILIVLLVAEGARQLSTVHFVSGRHDATFEKNLTAAVEAQERFRMDDVTAFEWDRMYMFPPYMPREHMEEAVGREWTKGGLLSYWYNESGLNDFPLSDESVHKLVFVNGEDVVMDITLYRRDADFTQIGESYYTPEDAVFDIQKTADQTVIVEAE